MRWLREFFRPSLRCARLGHRPTDRRRSTIRPNEGAFRGVADSCEETRQICKVCKESLSEWQIVKRAPIHSLSMPKEHWSILDRDGVFVTSED